MRKSIYGGTWKFEEHESSVRVADSNSSFLNERVVSLNFTESMSECTHTKCYKYNRTWVLSA